MPGCVPGSTEGTLHKSDSDLLAHFPFPNFSQCSHPNNFPDLPSDCILIMFLTGESFSQSQGWWLTSSAKQTSGMVPATGSNGCLFSQRDRDPVFTSLASHLFLDHALLLLFMAAPERPGLFTVELASHPPKGESEAQIQGHACALDEPSCSCTWGPGRLGCMMVQCRDSGHSPASSVAALPHTLGRELHGDGSY